MPSMLDCTEMTMGLHVAWDTQIRRRRRVVNIVLGELGSLLSSVHPLLQYIGCECTASLVSANQVPMLQSV